MINQRKNKAQREFIHIFNVDNLDPGASVTTSPPDPNRAMCFHGTKTFKSDEEIVSGSDYKFNLPIEKLIKNSDSTRLAIRNKNRVKGKQVVPRRQNAWILYRRDKSFNLEFEGKKSSYISKEIAKMWNEESRETVELFEALARKAVDIHKVKYGNGYKYRPSKSKEDVPSKNTSKKERRVVNWNKSSIMNAEQRSSVGPLSSSEFEESTPSESIIEKLNLTISNSHTTLSSSEIEESLSASTINTEQQLSSIPMTLNSHVTPSSSEIEGSSSASSSASITNTEQPIPVTSNFHSPVSPSETKGSSSASTERSVPVTSNFYSPVTPSSSETHSPVTPSSSEIDEPLLVSIINTEQFLPTPVTSNIHSPVTPLSSEIEEPLLVSIINAEQFLPTPVTSNIHSPATPSSLEIEGSLSASIGQKFLPIPVTSNSHSSISLKFKELPSNTLKLTTEQRVSPTTTMLNFQLPVPLDYEEPSPNVFEPTSNVNSPPLEGSLPNYLSTPIRYNKSDILQFSTLDPTPSTIPNCDFSDFLNSNNIAEPESFNGQFSEQSFIMTNIYFSYYTN